MQCQYLIKQVERRGSPLHPPSILQQRDLRHPRRLEEDLSSRHITHPRRHGGRLEMCSPTHVPCVEMPLLPPFAYRILQDFPDSQIRFPVGRSTVCPHILHYENSYTD